MKFKWVWWNLQENHWQGLQKTGMSASSATNLIHLYQCKINVVYELQHSVCSKTSFSELEVFLGFILEKQTLELFCLMNRPG